MTLDEYHVWWSPLAEWTFTLLWLVLWAWRPSRPRQKREDLSRMPGRRRYANRGSLPPLPRHRTRGGSDPETTRGDAAPMIARCFDHVQDSAPQRFPETDGRSETPSDAAYIAERGRESFPEMPTALEGYLPLPESPPSSYMG